MSKFLLVIFLLLQFMPSKAQQFVHSGELPIISYEYTGQTHYQEFPALTHALAYCHSTDVREVKAVKNYKLSYRVEKYKDIGFETTLSIKPLDPSGHLYFYQFYSPDIILPQISAIKLVMQKDENDIIYVKNFNELSIKDSTIVLKFHHQRFSPDWEIFVSVAQWKYNVSPEEFHQNWDWFNDYKSARLLLKDEILCEAPKEIAPSLIYKQRWLSIYGELERLPFFNQLINISDNDPAGFAKELKIRKFILSREIGQLQIILAEKGDSISVNSLLNAYVKVEDDFYAIMKQNQSLYSDLLFEFDPRAQSLYCFDELTAIFNRLGWSEKEWKEFELLYEQYNMEKIAYFIESKQPKEALFQIEKYDAFYSYASYLEKSNDFYHFKSKAIYEIYLSYVEVARKALLQDRIQLSMDYLDRASLIQEQYPKEIINDKYVEKELKNLIKRALSRYKQLLEDGDTEDAQQLKKGILGLMKKYNLSFHGTTNPFIIS